MAEKVSDTFHAFTSEMQNSSHCRHCLMRSFCLMSSSQRHSVPSALQSHASGLLPWRRSSLLSLLGKPRDKIFCGQVLRLRISASQQFLTWLSPEHHCPEELAINHCSWWQNQSSHEKTAQNLLSNLDDPRGFVVLFSLLGSPCFSFQLWTLHGLCQHLRPLTPALRHGTAWLSCSRPCVPPSLLPSWQASAPAGAGGAEVWEQLEAPGLSLRGQEHSWSRRSRARGALPAGSSSARQPRGRDTAGLRSPTQRTPTPAKAGLLAPLWLLKELHSLKQKSVFKAKWGEGGFCLPKTYRGQQAHI